MFADELKNQDIRGQQQRAATEQQQQQQRAAATATEGSSNSNRGQQQSSSSSNRGQQHAVKFLIDTDATESCIAEAFVSGIGAPLRTKLETLSIANGSLARSKGTVVLPINMQDYSIMVIGARRCSRCLQ